MTRRLLAVFFFTTVAYADTPGYTWKHCERPDDSNVTVPFTADKVFRPDCAPDVLYSWRKTSILNIYKENWKAKKIIFSNYSKLYTSRTPLASHGYGSRAVRIKLRDDVVFVNGNQNSDEPERDCLYYKSKYPGQHNKMVIVSSHKRYYQGFSEYILCDEGPIASWSYGTPEHLQEMEREYAFIKDKTPDQMDAARKQLGVVSEHRPSCPDYYECSLDHLNQVITDMRQSVAAGDGQVFYMPGVPKDRTKHFSVKRPGYFQYSEDKTKFSLANSLPEARPAEEKPVVGATK